MNLEEFRADLRKARKDQKLTQEMAGKMAGLSGQTIWAIETGYCNPRPSNVRKIAKALKMKKYVRYKGSNRQVHKG